MKDTEYQIGREPSEGRGHKVEDRSDGGAAQLLEGRTEGGGHRLRFDRGRSRKEAVEHRALSKTVDTDYMHLIYAEDEVR